VKLAIKIDVDTYRGTRDGVPRLVRLLQLHEAAATFLFSLGPDHTGRAIRRAFRPGFFSKVKRTSVLEHYGLKTLLYGTLLAGPDIGLRCRADWTEREMQKAFDRFKEVFGVDSVVHGAAGWQMNRHAAWFEERHFAYASDTRGREPFRPLWDGVAIGCPQIPTTLPTLDELIGMAGVDESNAAEKILSLTKNSSLQVFTAHAELEGGDWHGIFDALLSGWREQGYELVSLKSLHESLDIARLPRHEVVLGEIPGRSGTLALQG
jgi:hypothetical protein